MFVHFNRMNAFVIPVQPAEVLSEYTRIMNDG